MSLSATYVSLAEAKTSEAKGDGALATRPGTPLPGSPLAWTCAGLGVTGVGGAAQGFYHQAK